MSKRKLLGIFAGIILLEIMAAVFIWIKLVPGFKHEDSEYGSTKRSQKLQEQLREEIEVGTIRTEKDEYGVIVKTAAVMLPDYSVLFFLSTPQAEKDADSPEKFEELMLEEANKNLDSFLEEDHELVYTEREISLNFFEGEEEEKTEEEFIELFQQKALEDEMAQTAMLLMLTSDGEEADDKEEVRP